MTKVVIVGAGRGGRALLEMFMGDSTVSVLGVADVHPGAPGLELARRLNIPVSTDFRDFIIDPNVDLIIDVTGNPDVYRTIWRPKPPKRSCDSSRRRVGTSPWRPSGPASPGGIFTG